MREQKPINQRKENETMVRLIRRWFNHNLYRKRVTIGIVCFCFVSSAKSELTDAERFIDTEKATATQSNTLKRAYNRAQTDIPLSIILDPPTQHEKTEWANRRARAKALQIGFGRYIPPPYDKNLEPLMTWTAHPEGGNTAAFTVTSPGASAMRLALVVPRMEKGVEVRFFSGQLNQVTGPFTAKDIVDPTRQKASDRIAEHKAPAEPESEEFVFWSPVIEGETLGVEIYLPPSVDPGSFSISIPQVSHLVDSMSSNVEKSLSDIGTAGACNIDLACSSTTPRNLGNAVAKIIFTHDGNSFLCTGTLVNDNENDSFIPYFMTARHCISTQPEANTINTYWFFERSSCGAPPPTSVIQRFGGGELIRTGAKTDFSLLQLDDRLPAGVVLAGWDSAAFAPLSTGIGIHHPAGDLKKWSEGRHTGFAEYLGDVNDLGSYSRVIWSSGTTEGGSSGSGLFDTTGRFRGNLTGGSASCDAPNEPDWYGRFDLTYPAVKRWLWLHPTTLSSGVAINASVAKGKSREYRIRATGARRLTVRLTNLTQDADLYVRRANRPTLGVYTCRPFRRGNAAETCSIQNSGKNTYYIRVRGFSAGDTAFRIRATRS